LQVHVQVDVPAGAFGHCTGTFVPTSLPLQTAAQTASCLSGTLAEGAECHVTFGIEIPK
jgi:hypothetical protein